MGLATPVLVLRTGRKRSALRNGKGLACTKPTVTPTHSSQAFSYNKRLYLCTLQHDSNAETAGKERQKFKWKCSPCQCGECRSRRPEGGLCSFVLRSAVSCSRPAFQSLMLGAGPRVKVALRHITLHCACVV